MEEKEVKGAEATASKSSESSTMLTFENTQVENRLTFKPDARYNGICQGRISDVRLEMHEALKINADTGVESTYEYAGQTIPTLVIEFKQDVDKVNPKPRYYSHRFKIVPTKNKQGEAIDTKVIVSLINGMYEQLRHILNAYVGCKEYNTELGNPPGIDFNASIKDRVKMFTNFFTWFKKAFEGTDASIPMYKNYGLWIKLISARNGKYLTIPAFVGKGFVERIVPQQATTLQKEPNESFELIESKKSGTTERKASGVGAGDDELDAILADYK